MNQTSLRYEHRIEVFLVVMSHTSSWFHFKTPKYQHSYIFQDQFTNTDAFYIFYQLFGFYSSIVCFFCLYLQKGEKEKILVALLFTLIMPSASALYLIVIILYDHHVLLWLKFVFLVYWDFPHSSVGKESACNAGDPGSIPVSGRSPGEAIGYPLQYSWTSPMAQLVKNPPALQETWIRSLGWEDPLEKGKATHSNSTGEFHGLYGPWDCKESDMTEWPSLFFFWFIR